MVPPSGHTQHLQNCDPLHLCNPLKSMAHIQGLDPKISKGIRIFDTCPYYKALVGHDPELPQSIRFGLTPYHLVTSVGGDLSIQIPFGNQTPDWTTQKVTFSGVGLDVDVGRSQEFSSVSTCVMQHGNVRCHIVGKAQHFVRTEVQK